MGGVQSSQLPCKWVWRCCEPLILMFLFSIRQSIFFVLGFFRCFFGFLFYEKHSQSLCAAKIKHTMNEGCSTQELWEGGNGYLAFLSKCVSNPASCDPAAFQLREWLIAPVSRELVQLGGALSVGSLSSTKKSCLTVSSPLFLLSGLNHRRSYTGPGCLNYVPATKLQRWMWINDPIQ